MPRNCKKFRSYLINCYPFLVVISPKSFSVRLSSHSLSPDLIPWGYIDVCMQKYGGVLRVYYLGYKWSKKLGVKNPTPYIRFLCTLYVLFKQNE